MGKENTLSRRDFLIKSVKALGATALSSYAPGLTSTDFLNLIDPPIIKEPSKLETYLASIRADRERLEQIVAKNDIFSGFKYFTSEQRIDDLNRYFPIYRAADLKYQVPWLLLWIMHADETAVSRDLNPNQGQHRGAMQIDVSYKYLDEATLGWEFLADLPNQRYADDWKEILKAGLYIRNEAETRYKPEMEDGESVLEVVRYNYSASKYGKLRANQYLKMKALFD